MSSFEPSSTSSPPYETSTTTATTTTTTVNTLAPNNNITPYLSKSPPPPPTSDSPDDDDLDQDHHNDGSNIDADVTFNNHHNLTTNDDDDLSSSNSLEKQATNFDSPPPPPPPPPILSNDKSDNKASETGNVDNHENDDDDDDEWADFVDSSATTNNTPLNSNLFIPVVIPVTPTVAPHVTNGNFGLQSNQNLETNIPSFNFPVNFPSPAVVPSDRAPLPREKEHEQEQQVTGTILEETSPRRLNFDEMSSQILDRVFKSVDDEATRMVGRGDGGVVEQMSLADDDVWTSLREFTSVNDASTSLKFRWLFSELESSFLNSINVQRETISSNAQQKPYINYLSNGGVLQPTKLDAASTSGNMITNNNNNNNQNNEVKMTSFDELTGQNSNHKAISSNNNHNRTKSETTNSNVSTPVLDIDLSYFEQSPQPPNMNSMSSKPPSVKSVQSSNSSSSKTYINELLKEIYLNTNEKESSLSPKKSAANGSTSKMTTNRPETKNRNRNHPAVNNTGNLTSNQNVFTISHGIGS